MQPIKHYLLILAAWLIAAVIFCPVLLVFTTGSEGQPTIWNLIGIAYIALLIVTGKTLYKKL